MIINELNITQYRNLENVNLTCDTGLNVICGENGQGKTNILETIWLFTGSKSFNGGTINEQIPFDKDFIKVQMSFFGGERDNTASYSMGHTRKIELNQVKQRSLSSFAGNFFAVVFAPDHLSLVKGSPAERRKALDTVICQLKPRYAQVLLQYNKLLAQRNALLKSSKGSGSGLETLEEWDIALAKTGATITKTRRSYAELLAPIATEIYSGISGEREALTIKYDCFADDGEVTPENLYKILCENRQRDIFAGLTTKGAHRDDLVFNLDGRSAQKFGSQGQQRSVVLALKIAESDLIERLTDNCPVVLLDDVLSELDDNRREFLLNNLKNRQIFLTCCDYKQIEGAKTVFKVAGGRV